MDNDNYNDIDYEEFKPKQHGPVFKVFRGICLFFVALFCVFLAARMHINNNVPADAKQLLWDEQAYAAYTADPGSVKIYDHPLGSYIHPVSGDDVIRNTMTADAYFSFSDVCYSPSLSQVQLTLRYNVSTVDYLMADYELTEEPEGELFVFALEDGAGNRYYDYSYTAHEKSFLGNKRYNYRRLLFRGVDAQSADTLTLRIYYVGDTQGYRESADTDAVIDEIVVFDKTFEDVRERKELVYDAPAGVSELTESSED